MKLNCDRCGNKINFSGRTTIEFATDSKKKVTKEWRKDTCYFCVDCGKPLS